MSHPFYQFGKTVPTNDESNPYSNPLPFSGIMPGHQELKPIPVPEPEHALWMGTGETHADLLFHRVSDPTLIGRFTIPLPVPKNSAAWHPPDYIGHAIYPSLPNIEHRFTTIPRQDRI